MRLLRLAPALAVVSLGGCAAQSKNLDERDWTQDHGVEGGEWREAEGIDGPRAAGDFEGRDLPGVRLDLTLADDAKPDERCNCIDVAVGSPNDDRFRWADQRAAISGLDMVVALRVNESRCVGAPPQRRPSIQAVDTTKNDVVVVIEELRFDRPQALGAIVRRPGPRGRLYVRPRNRFTAYARGSHGDSCVVAFGEARR